MEDTRVTLRLPPDLFYKLKKLADAGDTAVSDLINKVLIDQYREGTPTMSPVVEKTVRREEIPDDLTFDDDVFIMPVGDVIGVANGQQTQLWWVSDTHSEYVKDCAKEWELNGFRLRFGEYSVDGDSTSGTWYCPDVIEEPEQERRKNGRFAPSTRGVAAHVGDKLVWLEITDADKALEFMRHQSDIPCAIRCDIHKYTSDTTYQAAVDKANELFITYYTTGRPKKVDSLPLTEAELEDMFDV